MTPRGLSAAQAAEYVGISRTKFLILVTEKRMPPPRIIDSRRVWDMKELDAVFDRLPHAGDPPQQRIALPCPE
jgi:predicted DNA-binding transcriptional regulator AlpA